MDVLDLISSDNYIPVNKSLAKEIGLENAIIFGALCGYQRGFKNEEFYREQNKIMEDTCLSEYSVRKAIKELQNLKLIFVVKKGLPAKYHFKINTTRVIEMLSTSGYENNTTGDYENNTTNNKNNNKNELNNIIKNNIVHIVDFLNEKASTSYKSTTPKTITLIKARLQEGFDVKDFEQVINNMCCEWKGTDMEKYLRPETLFGTKFESYLNRTVKKTVGKSGYTREELDEIDRRCGVYV